MLYGCVVNSWGKLNEDDRIPEKAAGTIAKIVNAESLKQNLNQTSRQNPFAYGGGSRAMRILLDET